MRPFFAFISPANRTCACMLCLTNSFNSCLSGTTTTEQMWFYKLRSCLRISKENRGLRFGDIKEICDKEWAALAAMDKENNIKMLGEYKNTKWPTGKASKAYPGMVNLIP